MRVLFVYSLRDALTTSRPLASLGNIHIGVSYLSSYLKAQGHETRVVVLNSETHSRSLALLHRHVDEYKPHIAGFTSVSSQYPFIRTAAASVRGTHSKIFLIAGGVHASLRPEEIINGPFDAVCVGEGEAPLAELAAQLESGKAPAPIPNLWIKRPDGSLERNSPREFNDSLDSLPFPDREMWRDWVMESTGENQVLLPTRGCAYNCTYCSNHALRKMAPGKYVRMRSPGNIIKELQHLKTIFPATRDVYLQSETIAVKPGWLQELSRTIEVFNTGLAHPISFTCNFRVARPFLTEPTFTALKRANVRTVEIGLETGSERLRSEVLRRHYSNEEFYRAVALARQNGMRVNVYNIIGIPGETAQDYWETVETNRRVCPDQAITSIFYPYPGTDLYQDCLQKGLLTGTSEQTSERWRATLDLPGFPRREVQRAFEWFDYRVYRGHRPWLFRFRRVLRGKAYAHPAAHALFMRLLPLWHALRNVNASRRRA